MKLFAALILLSISLNASAQSSALPDLKVSVGPYPITPVHGECQYGYSSINGNNLFLLVPGDKVQFSVDVWNIGQADSGKFTLHVSLRDYKTYTQQFNSLQPGESVTLTEIYTIEDDSGDLNIEAEITTMEREDWNESNNHYTTDSRLVWRETDIKFYNRPDLELTLSSPDKSRHLHRTVKLLVKVTNTGKTNSAKTQVLLKCTGKNDKKVDVPALKPNASFTKEFQHKWGSLGTKKCTATVDISNKITEKRGDNNSQSLKIKIK